MTDMIGGKVVKFIEDYRVVTSKVFSVVYQTKSHTSTVILPRSRLARSLGIEF